ncbi:NmrA family NAD(P)-binding protein [Streptosporangium sp. G11]|uniref:NmrA family NAD(P)-binding protein n=1 Tax=Streptosporangium sp. G11 TaxID=3436926 RepID=UPI003EB89183
MTGADTILVTGATGNTGRRVADRLVERGHRVRTASRHRPERPEAARRHVRFDWDDQDTYRAVLDGVRGIYLIPPLGDTEPARQMRPFLDLALDAGVRRVVLLSASAVPAGGTGLGLVHTAIGEMFPEWAVLRPSWFMQNLANDHMHAHGIRERGEIVTATGDGRVGFIDAADIAAVAVRALTDPVPHNTDHLLTGPQALSYAEVAATITELSGRPVRHRGVTVDVLRQRLADTGIPDDFAALLAGMDHAIAGGAEDRTTSTVTDVTGDAPTSFREFCAVHARRWRPAGVDAGPAVTP